MSLIFKLFSNSDLTGVQSLPIMTVDWLRRGRPLSECVCVCTCITALAFYPEGVEPGDFPSLSSSFPSSFTDSTIYSHFVLLSHPHGISPLPPQKPPRFHCLHTHILILLQWQHVQYTNLPVSWISGYAQVTGPQHSTNLLNLEVHCTSQHNGL